VPIAPGRRLHVVVAGAGVTGTHAARHLHQVLGDVTVTITDPDGKRAGALAERLDGATAPSLQEAGPFDVAVLCAPSADQPPLARAALARGAGVVCTADGLRDVQELLALGAEAVERGLPLAIGAGFSPGLSCVLARHAGDNFDVVDEVHVAKTGTGGPDCARQHHRALTGRSWDWRDGGWVRRRGGSGRQLAWFPDPIGARDCYRAGLADALLLQRAFPDATRVTSRMSATRRDRLTGWLPMLRPPHADGGPGAVRVEVWGRRGDARDVVVYGCADHPALAAGIVAAATVAAIVAGDLPAVGTFGLAETAAATSLLETVHRLGVVASSFEGAP
jgi:saccharopine dehydrogenase-like NADP-dependent oxidoreductase